MNKNKHIQEVKLIKAHVYICVCIAGKVQVYVLAGFKSEKDISSIM